ncbi:ABC-type transport auxiliary lipoprotein family protein [Lysobacter sp. CFH 32150]|uniref:ABC-type transport auxiliary lipoprotein family protein n=1 Tax=Lysobacter sp. CFH 32150 TaxID=2927128 RepID=UPI001FA767DC|nr:ABC-type transport auxiliary lipoprotein family protein [Lysobacter sp. CFH 32150]MCI4567646.1 ABC-type transport auxiliary lipoprotein family protein [Lysobacter sp. CFH 32150]
MTTSNARATASRFATCLGMLLLAGCSILGPKPKDAATVYAPDPRVQAEASWPTVRWQLALGRPQGARNIDSQRIAVRPTPNELQVYKGAQWAKPPGEMLEDALLRALEDSGRIPAVGRQGSGIGADYRLLLDLRRFESDYAGNATPAATIEVSAKLLHVKSQQVVASRTFLQAQPAAGTAVPEVVNAFEQALATISRDLAGWTLTTGNSYEPVARAK